MPRHPDFETLYNRFVSEYGIKEGESIYYAYVHNEGLKEEESLSSQKNNDAIENNVASTQKSLDSFIKSEKEKYALIIDKFMAMNYDSGISEAAKELSILPEEFGSNKERLQQLKVLQANSKQLMFNLMDDINKEIALVLTNTSLNNIPFTNSELKKEVQKIFSNKQGRLNSQVVSETDRSFNTALEFGYKKSGVITHKQWVAVIDGVTSPTCQQLNGEIVQIGKPFSLGFYSPPAHPNCRSRIVGITISEADMLKKSDSNMQWYELPRFKGMDLYMPKACSCCQN